MLLIVCQMKIKHFLRLEYMHCWIIFHNINLAECFHQHIDCKTVGFFLKISKEIGKAWGKTLMRAKRERKKTDCPFSTQ